ncbi:MAG: hypothetical protein O7C59_00775 [Rickettsia endosymbiont of Ixodes persulcatus]|nr:hypothetical protein [Rickettsia endosymbiont of Ixodes persulcatus]MCZ6902778.1 hypothetical protein [Rickettsia endosymbiont of Ixodes persulcatus]MCZ6909083.1 hypothetical protein [Rickettsia endosymbiont of Ixodes persulcatus]MCZ6910874.1 hypothetical protein [Rickettsia endosymbiont of Ixodes persulcatus]MCZ6913187.1 hypothetical protein [Rickettsia endosymbiont of Ixodes persulcatus]
MREDCEIPDKLPLEASYVRSLMIYLLQ